MRRGGRPRAARTAAIALTAAAVGLGIARRSRPRYPIRGAVALVTGGSRGLGFLIARELLDQGCAVAICARDAATLDRARRRLAAETNGGIEAFECDVADAGDAADLIARVVRSFGRLDVLVNNAAIIQVAPVQALRAQDFRRVIDIGLMGTVHTTLAALPHLVRARGRIANITSIGGMVAVPHLLPYDCAKFAAVGFSEGLHAELARTGVRVTTVVPGLMRTGSPVHVEYVGDPAAEYTWFTLGDLLPIAAMSAQRAARRIVRAIRRGETEVVLSWQARLLRFAHAVAPVPVTRLLAVANRLLPRPAAGDGHMTRRAAGADASRAARNAAEPERAYGTDLRGVLPNIVEAALDRTAARANQF